MHNRYVTEVGKEPGFKYWFRIENWPLKFWVGDSDIWPQPGDRVRITITKEPDIAQPSIAP